MSAYYTDCELDAGIKMLEMNNQLGHIDTVRLYESFTMYLLFYLSRPPYRLCLAALFVNNALLYDRNLKCQSMFFLPYKIMKVCFFGQKLNHSVRMFEMCNYIWYDTLISMFEMCKCDTLMLCSVYFLV